MQRLLPPLPWIASAVVALTSCGTEVETTSIAGLTNASVRVALRAVNGRFVRALADEATLLQPDAPTGTGTAVFWLHPRGAATNGILPVALEADNGRYVTAEAGGGRELRANRLGTGPWETFGLHQLGGRLIALQANSGQYVVAENAGLRELRADRTAIGPWEQFELVELGPTSGPMDLDVVAITLDPPQPRVGDEVRFSATVRNRGGQPTPAGVTLGVGFEIAGTGVYLWHTADQVIQPGEHVTLTSSGGNRGTSSWTATAGAHRVTAIVDDVSRFAEQNRSNNSRTLGFSVETATTAPAPTKSGRLGINLDPPNTGRTSGAGGRPEPTDLQQLGATWVRIEWKSLSNLQPSPIEFYRQQFAAYRAAGARVLLLVDYASLPEKHPDNAEPDAAWGPYLQAFTSRVAALAAEYHDEVDAWQVWNEPDDGAACDKARCWRQNDNPQYEVYVPPRVYGEMLDRATAAIRSHRQDAVVITAGLDSGNPGYLQLAMNGRAFDVDGVAIHPYGQRPERSWPASNWGFGYLGDLIDSYYKVSQQKPIWITEYGVRTEELSHDGGRANVLQGQFLQKAVNTVQTQYAAKVPAMIWFAWSDAMVATYGLHDAAGNRKPAYSAFQAAAQTEPKL